MEFIENAGYYHAKQACYRCLSPHNGVDLDIQIEGEGALFLCRGCISDAAKACGFDVEDRGPEIERLRDELAESRRAQLDAEQQVLQAADAAKKIREKRLEHARQVRSEQAAMRRLVEAEA